MNYTTPHTNNTAKYCPRCGMLITSDAVELNGFLYHPWCRNAIIMQMPQNTRAQSQPNLYANNQNPYSFNPDITGSASAYNQSGTPYTTNAFSPDRFRFLQNNFFKAIDSGAETYILEDLRRQLLDIINCSGGIYVLVDKDFNPEYPFITVDENIEIFTYQHLAFKCQNHYSHHHTGHTEIKQINDTVAFLTDISNMGIRFFKVNNGNIPVSGEINQLISIPKKNFVEANNLAIRCNLLKELQYAYRIRNMHPSQRNGKIEKKHTEMMILSGRKAYNELANSIVYVLTSCMECTSDQVMCSDEVYEKLTEITNGEIAIPFCKGDFSNDYYIRNISGTGVSSGNSLCVYTGYDEARKALAKIPTNEPVNCIAAVTFSSISAYNPNYDNILIDSEGLGYMLPISHFKKTIIKADKTSDIHNDERMNNQ